MGNTQLKHDDLMHTAKDIYDMRKTNTEEPYMAKSPEQMQIEALTVQLEQAKASKVFKKGGGKRGKKKGPRKI